MSCHTRAVTRELPDNIPFTVTENYIRAVTARWEAPAIDLFESVEEVSSKQNNGIRARGVQAISSTRNPDFVRRYELRL